MRSIDFVIILGAGASFADGAPLQKNLINKYFDSISQEKTEESQTELINKYFEMFWGIDIVSGTEDLTSFPTFEDCLGILDTAKNRNENFKLNSKEDLNKFRNSLIFLIAKTIERELGHGPSVNHEQLVKRLIKEGTLNSTAFISFNYDIIIDNILTKLRELKDLDLDYGIEFMNFDWEKDGNEDSWGKADPNKSLYLLKIHGSLNWLYCPTCNQIEITPKTKGAVKAFVKSEKCKTCKTFMEPIIIPPTYFKDMNNVYLQQIFQKSDQILRNAKRIFICGYSLPEADLHIKYLLKRAELLNQNQPDFFIINNHREKRDANEEKARFLQFFKNKDKIHYTELSFENFCKNGV